MYNDFIKQFKGERTLNVKIGDTVAVQGFRGTVLDVFTVSIKKYKRNGRLFVYILTTLTRLVNIKIKYTVIFK